MTDVTHIRKPSRRNLGFAIVAAGVFTLTSGVVSSQPAKAFGMSDIFGVVEDVWEIGADGVERVGRAVGKKAKKIGRGTLTPTGSRRGRRAVGKPVGGGNASLPPSRRPASSLPPSRRPSSSAGLPPSRGVAKPIGNRGLPPPRRTSQRPKPITANDIKPYKPICNSKFENCSGQHGKKWKNGGARDKSVWGRPVGLKKSAKKIQRVTRDLKIKRTISKQSVRNLKNKRMKSKRIIRTLQIKKSKTVRFKRNRDLQRAQQKQLKHGFKVKRMKRNTKRRSNRRLNRNKG